MTQNKDLLERMKAYEAKHKPSLVEDVIIDEAPISDIENTEAPETAEENGIAYTINKLIIDEWEAISSYNDAILMLSTQEGFESEVNVLRDIVAEENIHIGQLQKLLEKFSPNAKNIAVGEEEAATQLVEAMNISNSYKIDKPSCTFRVTKTDDGKTYISSIHLYDDAEYHWAYSKDDINYKIFIWVSC